MHQIDNCGGSKFGYLIASIALSCALNATILTLVEI